MKIKELKVRELAVPLTHPYALSRAYGVHTVASVVALEIVTDAGVVGWGECDPWAAFTGETAGTVCSVLRTCLGPMLIGMDPTNLRHVHQCMDGALRSNHTAKACVDVACYDILGKTCGLPVCKLIGGTLRDGVRCFWAVGGSTPEETVKEIVKIKEDGFWGCMIKIGTDYRLDAARTLAARDAVGPEFPLIADANQGWDVDTAISYGKLVESANLLFFEQPVKFWDVDGLAKVRSKVPMPVSADEGVTTIQDARLLIAARACDYFSIKVSKHGGILPTMQLCEYAAVNGISLFFNSMLEEGITQAASLHVACTVPNILATTGHSFFSTLRLQSDITDFYSWTRDGFTSLSGKAGLGLEINQKNLDKYTVKSFTIKG